MHYPRSGGARAAAVVAANATFPAVLLVVGGYPDPDPDDRPDLGAHAHARPIRGMTGCSPAQGAICSRVSVIGSFRASRTGITTGCPRAGWGEREFPAALRQQRLSWQPPGCRIPC